MTVIKPDYISEEITIHDVLPLSFLKKSVYTGSKGGMRFRMEKAEVPEAQEETAAPVEEAAVPTKTVLLVSVWPEPYAYAKTESGLIKTAQFAFSKEGIDGAILWLNQERLFFQKAGS